MKLNLDRVLYATPPTGVALVSTVGPGGRRNVAPFAWCILVSKRPPLFALSVKPDSHTYQYISETHEFVIGFPEPQYIDKVYAAAKPMVTDDEFVEVGFTPTMSRRVRPPGIAECQSRFECILRDHIQTGDHVLIIGEVVDAEVNDNVYDDDDAKMRYNLKPLGHLTKHAFIELTGKRVDAQVIHSSGDPKEVNT